MMLRCFLVIPVAFITWCASSPILRPNQDNWLWWVAYSDTWWSVKLTIGFFCFGVIVAIGGCLVLLCRRSCWLFAAVAGSAYVVGNFIGIGYLHSFNEPMDVHVFAALALSMTAAVPMCFADQLAGKQVDIVGDGQ